MSKWDAGKEDKKNMKVLDEKKNPKVLERKKYPDLFSSFLSNIFNYQFISSVAYFSYQIQSPELKKTISTLKLLIIKVKRM